MASPRLHVLLVPWFGVPIHAGSTGRIQPDPISVFVCTGVLNDTSTRGAAQVSPRSHCYFWVYIDPASLGSFAQDVAQNGH
jgi:hypothetical protein